MRPPPQVEQEAVYADTRAMQLFAETFGTDRGRARDRPPQSTCCPVCSLADFDRRLATGVLGVFEQFDHEGRVRAAQPCRVTRASRSRWSAEFFEPPDVKLTLASSEMKLTLPFPRRASSCSFNGSSVRHSLWRFTFTDESKAVPTALESTSARARVTDADRDAMSAAMKALPAYEWRKVRFRYWQSGATPMFGWTTTSDEFGYYWSFCFKQASLEHSDAGRVIELKDHRLRRDARAHAEAQFTAAGGSMGGPTS
jgi:hypothetical protein